MIDFPIDSTSLPLVLLGHFVMNVLAIALVCSVGFFFYYLWHKKRRIFAIKVSENQLKREIRHSLVVLLVDSFLTIALFQSGLLRPLTSLNWAWTILVFAAHFVFFEVWFYCSHRLLHSRALFKFHAIHHQSRVCTPISNFSGSVTDRLFSATGFIIPLLAFSYFGLLPLAAFNLILITNAFGTMMLHSNLEVLAGTKRQKWRSLLGHSISSHALHHSRIHGNFGLFTSFMDHMFGTYIPDTDDITLQVASGKPLTSLRQRSEKAPEAELAV
ncbi:sterol desaturase family protein [Oligoflexus tunisiensis]|uniref:sterol desaturase family protein n=1 Tax=Oligoflexus tunisiensis TaxID=708132 RepID=UPI00114D2AE0|nr:sterol desaturase family protein [Oligoflexus tunisiensis]